MTPNKRFETDQTSRCALCLVAQTKLLWMQALGEPATRLSTLLDTLTALGLEIIIDKRGKVSRQALENLF